MKKILCVCTETHTGMRDFVIPIIKAASVSYEIITLYVKNPNLGDDLDVFIDKEKSFVLTQPNNKVGKMQYRIYSFQLLSLINKICYTYKIGIVWLMSGDAMVAPFIKILQKKYIVYYTVHDLFPHEAPYRTFKQKAFYYYFFQRHFDKLLKCCDRLITSSKSQYNYIVKNLRDKKAYYHPFPSLVNQSIVAKQCPELEGVDNYILYFSTIGYYKGVDLLYNAFINSSKLQKFRLVIVGAGKIYFKRNSDKEQNVRIINRYVLDREIPALFRYSIAVVFPYRTATQSGNISYAYYHKKPLLLSDIPYFKEVAENGKTALFFKSEDTNSLQHKLECLLFNTNLYKMRQEQEKAYVSLYSPSALSEYIKRIFC